MSAPQLTRYVNGPTAVSGDQLNTFMQTCDTAAQLRYLIGAAGMSVFLRGINAANDGDGGAFYWNSTATGPDDDINTIVPFGAGAGAWVRITTIGPQSIVFVLSNIASLRALGGSFIFNTVWLDGYVTGGDGGGGTFWYNPNDTTSPDNGGTIIVDQIHRRWYRQWDKFALDVLWFGGSGASDFSVLFDAALAVATTLSATQTGICIRFPAEGMTFLSEVGFTYPAGKPFSLTLRGAGTDASVLNWPTANGIALSMSQPQHTIHMLDMTVANGGQGARTGVSCNQSSPQGIFWQNDFTRVTFRGTDGINLSNYWATGIAIVGLGNINFDGCLFYGQPVDGNSSLGVGVSLAGLGGGAAPFGIVYNFTDCSFWELNNPIIYGSNIQGVSINACNFTNCTDGVFQPIGSVGGAQLAVMNSQFACFTAAILVAGNLNNIQFTNSLVLLVTNNASAIGLATQSNVAYLNITGSEFATVGTPTGTNGIFSAGTTQFGVVTGNIFAGLVTAVVLDAGSTNWNVQSNAYNNCTNKVINNGGSSNIIGGGSE